MKHLAAMIALASVGAMASLGLVSAPSASADVDSYIYRLEHSGYGYTGNKSSYRDLGYRVCADWESGYTRSAIVTEVWLHNDYTHFVKAAAQNLVDTAIAEICP